MDLINFNRFEMSDFYFVCPYDFDDPATTTRKREVAMWRNVGMIWAWLSGNTVAKSAKMFNRHHATLVYAIEQLKISFEGYGHAEIIENINEIKSKSIEVVSIENDISTNYAISCCILDKKIGEMYFNN